MIKKVVLLSILFLALLYGVYEVMDKRKTRGEVKSQNERAQLMIPDQPLTSPLPARAGARVVTPEWLLSLPNNPWVNPTIRWLNNSKLIYASPPTVDKKGWTIELIDVNTREHKMLGEGSLPQPSPDGQRIAFIKGENEAKQLWSKDSKGENLKQLTHIEKGIGNDFFEFSWSPDSKQIAFAHQPYVGYWEKRQPPKSTLNLIDIASGKLKKIASYEESIHYLSWFPNGNQLLITRERIGVQFKEGVNREWVQSLNINNSHLRTLTEFEGLQQTLNPKVSPNGKWVAFMYDADNPDYYYMPSICLVSTDVKESDKLQPLIRLTYELKLSVPQWSPDSSRIYARRDYGAYSQLYTFDAKTGKPTQITHAPLRVGSYALSPDGSHLAWIGEDAQGTRILRTATSDGHKVRDLIIIPGVPSDVALSEVREVDWQAPDYPSRMRGLLIMPLNYKEGTRYPLIVDIHGGGAGASIYLLGGILMTTPLEWQMWAAKGYAVFVPEFRSSASFGSLAITRDEFQNHDLINSDIKDIEAGIDSLIAAGIVDKNRLAVIGHSAGGRRSNWLIASTHRFKAVISKEGWADDWIENFTETPSKAGNIMYGGQPWEVPQNYFKNSALYHVGGATTPTLFLMGNPEIGGVDPHNTVQLFYNALKAQGVEAQYVKYDDEGHNFEQPNNRRDALERSIKWIDKHIGKE